MLQIAHADIGLKCLMGWRYETFHQPAQDCNIDFQSKNL